MHPNVSCLIKIISPENYLAPWMIKHVEQQFKK